MVHTDGGCELPQLKRRREPARMNGKSRPLPTIHPSASALHSPSAYSYPVGSRNSEHLETMGYYGRSR